MGLISAEGRKTLLNNRAEANGQTGVQWVEGLPGVIQRMAAQWSLELQAHFPNLSYNYVAPVVTANGEQAVLKLCLPDHDFLCEAEAVRAFDGNGCVRLLDLDREAGAMLLERVEPGVEVHTLNDDVAETSAAAAVMRELQRPYAGLFPFPNAADWINEALDPATIPTLKVRYPWTVRALERLTEIASQPHEEVLLHGDLHHDNILSSRREPWLAIDPHGVIGDPAWEIAPFLFNRLERYSRDDWPAIIRRRAGQFAEELSLDRQRVYAWSAVRAIQSAWWSLRDAPSYSGPIYEGSIVCAMALTE